MNIVKFNDPFFSFPSIIRDMMVDKDFFSEMPFKSLRFISTHIPLVNTFENDKEYVLEVLAPGIDKSDLLIETISDELIMKLKENVESKNEIDSEDRLRKEYHFEFTERKFRLPDNVNTKKITAESNNGIIKVVIPKEEPKIPPKKQIEIK